MGHIKSSSNREVYSNTGFLKKQEKSQMNNLTYHLKELGKEEQSAKPAEGRK